MTKKKPDKLPDKLSALILVALADLTKAERSPKYRIDMDVWHVPNSHCSVCFGGAVMAFSLRVASSVLIEAQDFDTPTQNKLFALNNARDGWFDDAITNLGGSDAQCRQAMEATGGITIPRYGRRNGFKPAMRKAAKALAAVGL
jgi:hypothetical protein